MKHGIFYSGNSTIPSLFFGVWYPLIGNLLYQVTKTSYLMVPSSPSSFFFFLFFFLKRQKSLLQDLHFFSVSYTLSFFLKMALLLFTAEKPLTLIPFFYNYYPYPIIKKNSFFQDLFFFPLLHINLVFKKIKIK